MDLRGPVTRFIGRIRGPLPTDHGSYARLRRVLGIELAKAERDLSFPANCLADDELAWIEQAKKVLEAREALAAANRRVVLLRVLPLPAVASLIVFAYLLFIPVGYSEIEAEINTRMLTFETADGVRLGSLQRIGRFLVTESTRIEPPADPAGNIAGVQTTRPFSAVNVNRTLSITEMDLSPGTAITLDARDSDESFTLRLASKSPDILPIFVLNTPRGTVFEGLRASSRRANGSLKLLVGSTFTATISPQLDVLGRANWPVSVRTISFEDADSPPPQSQRRAPISWIEGGSVIFSTIDKRIDLRGGQWFRPEMKRGSISNISFQGHTLSIHFQAMVRDLTIGSGSTTRSVMPTILEEWQANKKYVLYSLTVGGFLSSLLVIVKLIQGGT